MSKEDVLADFQSAFQLPGVEKSGNILADELNRKARRYLVNDREGLVGAVAEWLDAKDPLLTVQAAVLVREFRLTELEEATRLIRDEVVAGAFLRPNEAWVFDRALERLGSLNLPLDAAAATNRAKEAAVARGHPWVEPVMATLDGETFVVTTNAASLGGNVVVIIERTSGAVLDLRFYDR